MAYNFLCKTQEPADFVKINKIMGRYKCLEAFPVELKDSEIPALAISVPAKNVSGKAYRELAAAYRKLSQKYKFVFYDLYYGKEVDRDHLKVLGRELK